MELPEHLLDQVLALRFEADQPRQPGVHALYVPAKELVESKSVAFLRSPHQRRIVSSFSELPRTRERRAQRYHCALPTLALAHDVLQPTPIARKGATRGVAITATA
jgi:hypothetical protein